MNFYLFKLNFYCEKDNNQNAYEPPHGKTNNLHRRKQRRRSAQLRGNREADQRLCFRYSDSTIPLLLNFEISSFYPAYLTVQPVRPVRKPHCWFSHEVAHILSKAGVIFLETLFLGKRHNFVPVCLLRFVQFVAVLQHHDTLVIQTQPTRP